MKSAIVAMFVFLGFSAHAEVVKKCVTTITFDGNSSDHIFIVESHDDQLSGVILQTVNGFNQQLEYDTVKVVEGPVRKGLTARSMDDDDLTLVENYITHAMAIAPLGMDPGFDLTLARSAKVWLFVEPGTNIGSTAIIEGFDKDGESLGSFIGGFLVGACR